MGKGHALDHVPVLWLVARLLARLSNIVLVALATSRVVHAGDLGRSKTSGGDRGAKVVDKEAKVVVHSQTRSQYQSSCRLGRR